MNEQNQQLTELELDAVVGGSVKDTVVTIVNGVVKATTSLISAIGNAYDAVQLYSNLKADDPE